MRSVRLAAEIVPLHGLDEAAGDGEPQAGARPGHGRPSARDRTCRTRCSRSAGGMPGPSSDHLQHRLSPRRASCGCEIVVPRRRIFRGIVEQIEQHLLEQHGIELEHRQIGGELQLDAGAGQDLAGPPQRAADDLAEIVQRRVRHDGAGLELGHVEQIGDEAVEPLGLVDDGGEQLGLLGVGRASPTDRAACRRRRAPRPAAS